MPTRNKNSLAVIRKKKKEMADQIVHLVDENAQLKDRIVDLENELELSRAENEALRSSKNGMGAGSRAAAAKVIRLPTETWVDVFKFLFRRTLLRNVQPTCRRFHAIAERHVDNVHVIRYSFSFFYKLEQNFPEGTKHYEELVANDASLAKHFQLCPDSILRFNVNRLYEADREAQKRRHHFEKCVLRHSLELFRDCVLQLWMLNENRMITGEFMAYLELFQLVRPFHIHVIDGAVSANMHIDELLRHPTILHCPRLTLYHKVHA